MISRRTRRTPAWRPASVGRCSSRMGPAAPSRCGLPSPAATRGCGPARGRGRTSPSGWARHPKPHPRPQPGRWCAAAAGGRVGRSRDKRARRRVAAASRLHTPRHRPHRAAARRHGLSTAVARSRAGRWSAASATRARACAAYAARVVRPSAGKCPPSYVKLAEILFNPQSRTCTTCPLGGGEEPPST